MDVSVILVHVSMGVVSLISGTAALLFREGHRLHRTAGNIFFLSMVVMSLLGSYAAIFKPEAISVLNGILTAYLVATAWSTVRYPKGKAIPFEVGAMIIILVVGISLLFFGLQAIRSESGLKDGIPARAYFFFATIALLAAAFDIRMIWKKGLNRARRTARHLWRMCFALFIAMASFFTGQPQLFPEQFQRIEILSAPAILVIVVMVYWLVRVHFASRAATNAID